MDLKLQNSGYKIMSSTDKYRDEFVRRQKKFPDRLRKLTDKLAYDISKLSKSREAKFVKKLSYNRAPDLSKQLDIVVATFGADLVKLTENEVRQAWKISSAKNTAIITAYLATIKEAGKYKVDMVNAQLLEAYIKRGGPQSLSERVWKLTKQVRSEMRVMLSLGIANGEDAGTIARSIKKFLINPDLQFRRVMKNGKLSPSKAMKLWHPGRGVYRSATKNALRVSRTETNQAFLFADYVRWNSLPMVIGIKISLSPQHPEYKHTEICEELQGIYPKSFLFVGWHPQCLCHAVPVLMDKDKFRAYLRGEAEEMKSRQIRKLPANFTKWIKDHQYTNPPYFIVDNPNLVEQAVREIVVNNVYTETLANQGYSTDLTGKKPTSGYMVSVPNHEKVVPLDNFNANAIQKYISSNRADLEELEAFLGTWVNEGKVYFDVSVNIGDLQEALELGKKYKQLAIFDLSNFSEIKISE